MELKESTVRTWRNMYHTELKKVTLVDPPENLVTTDVKLPLKKKGRPFLLGTELDRQVQAYILRLRDAGCVVNSALVVSAAMGIVKKHDSNLLSANGGPLSFKKSWANWLLSRMGMVKRKATTGKPKLTASEFEALKSQMLIDIKCTVSIDEIPPALIVNWDQTAIHYVPQSNWTMAKSGSSRVEVTGLGDKRQITAVFSCTSLGKFLPIQLVYQGKTSACHPQIDFPAGWSITHSANHWSNEATMEEYIETILVPYITATRQELGLSSTHPALALFDVFRGQCTDKILSLLEKNSIHFVNVPANTTDRLQPLDISVNKSAKDFLREKFTHWYANKIAEADDNSVVDLRLSILKPLSATWMVQFHDYISSKPIIIVNGFHHAGISDILDIQA